jgi:hypothetical protein
MMFAWVKRLRDIQDIAHLFDNGQHPRLVVVVTVGPDAEVDLLRKGICLVGRGELENAVATVSVLLSS